MTGRSREDRLTGIEQRIEKARQNNKVPGAFQQKFMETVVTLVDARLWWLIALLGMATAGRLVFFFGCQFTNVPFMLTCAALLQKNLLVYGLGGIIVPFIGIKAIDILITAVHLA